MDAPPVEMVASEPVSSEGTSLENGEGEADKPARTRRAPRARKAAVDVTDRSNGDAADVAPKPVTLGDDVASVQAAPEDS